MSVTRYDIKQDAALVFEFFVETLALMETNGSPRFTAAHQAAGRVRAALNKGFWEDTAEDPVVARLEEPEIPALRQAAVALGWFEVPVTNSYERLRMIDAATGNRVVVYQGRKGIKAVANVGQPAAQQLLRTWKDKA